MGLVPIAIVGGLSRFTPGLSAIYQRIWTMTWLLFGCVLGFFGVLSREPSIEVRPISWQEAALFLLCLVPPIGGYVVVAQMISDFGVCELF